MQGFPTRSFDDLGAPLPEVTFTVIDLETTGGSPAACAITRGGEAAVLEVRLIPRHLPPYNQRSKRWGGTST